MLDENTLKRLIHDPSVAKFPKEKILLCLGLNDNKAKRINEIKAIAVSMGANARMSNISSMLLRSKGLAIRTDQGWELSPQGVDWLKKILEAQPGTGPRISLAKSLRDEAEKLTSLETKAFVLEAVECFERKLYRAAVVLSWQGALGLLYDNVIKTHLNTFNAEAKRRNSKWKSAVTRDDLALMKESDFLDVSEAISMIGKSVKKELKNALDFRNGCGHPNSLKISENMVSAHIENLILNVFSLFGQ